MSHGLTFSFYEYSKDPKYSIIENKVLKIVSRAGYQGTQVQVHIFPGAFVLRAPI